MKIIVIAMEGTGDEEQGTKDKRQKGQESCYYCDFYY